MKTKLGNLVWMDGSWCWGKG